mmetsp:Transcript_23176/g.19718  ORF Transcript_23176/g.19718 Transcript_23176/m.19718 type:complete len:145 (-) Transcript_23176:1-435(-)
MHLAASGSADPTIFGFQVGEDVPRTLTVLCPQYGYWCLFNLPPLRKQFRKIKVRSTYTKESSDLTFVLQWNPDARKAYTGAVRNDSIFLNMKPDGFGYISFNEDGDEVWVGTSDSEGGWANTPGLDPEEAKRLCDQLGCLYSIL